MVHVKTQILYLHIISRAGTYNIGITGFAKWSVYCPQINYLGTFYADILVHKAVALSAKMYLQHIPSRDQVQILTSCKLLGPGQMG